MKDEILFSITEVTDDETGIWQAGELEYALHVKLDEFIKRNGSKGVEEIKTMLRTIEGIVDEKLAETESFKENQSMNANNEVEAASRTFSPCIIENYISLS